MSNDPEETVILHTRPHILFLILPILMLVVLWLFYLFVFCPLFVYLDDGCSAISGLSFFLIIFVLNLEWINNRLILTNRRVTRQKGIIGKTVITFQLNRVQDIKIHFGILGRIFGFGVLEIESAGTFGKILYRGIPSPKMVKQKIENEIQKATTCKS